jgi:Flp pilus assembly pilin Flp
MDLRTIVRWLRSGAGEAGQTMVEYAIVAALIAVVAMIAVEGLGTGISGVFDKISSELTGI